MCIRSIIRDNHTYSCLTKSLFFIVYLKIEFSWTYLISGSPTTSKVTRYTLISNNTLSLHFLNNILKLKYFY